MQTYSRKTHSFVGKVIWFSIYQLPYYIFLEQLLSEKTPNEVLSKDIRVLYKSIIIFLKKCVWQNKNSFN